MNYIFLQLQLQYKVDLHERKSLIIFDEVLDSGWSDKMLELIAELKDSKTVLISYHTNDPNAGMANNKDLTKFKMFLCDTGLFVTLMFKDKDFTENIIYEKLLKNSQITGCIFTKIFR